MPYRVRVTETARREIGRLPGYVRQRIRRIVQSLGDEPTPSGARELGGLAGSLSAAASPLAHHLPRGPRGLHRSAESGPRHVPGRRAVRFVRRHVPRIRPRKGEGPGGEGENPRERSRGWGGVALGPTKMRHTPKHRGDLTTPRDAAMVAPRAGTVRLPTRPRRRGGGGACDGPRAQPRGGWTGGPQTVLVV